MWLKGKVKSSVVFMVRASSESSMAVSVRGSHQKRPEEKGTKDRAGNDYDKELYTVDEAIEKMGFGPFQWMITLLCGTIVIADTIEIMVLSILPFLCKCQWDLSSAEEAAISSAMFIGAMIGCTFWGFVADSFGRKKVVVGMGLILLTFGSLSAVKLTPNDSKYPGYPWLLVCRLGVGLGTSCNPQMFTYYIEFLPRKARAICTVFVLGWGSVGSIIAAALATAVMVELHLGWHWYLGISACPFVLVLVMVPFFPESARYYLAQGKQKEAMKVLARIAWVNCKPLPEGEFVLHVEKYNNQTTCYYDSKVPTTSSYTATTIRGSINSPLKDESVPLLKMAMNGDRKPSWISGFCRKFSLFVVGGKWKVTSILVVISFTFGWLYYGSVLLTSTIIEYNPHCSSNGTVMPNTSNSSCNSLDKSDFLEIMSTAAAELPGTLVNIIIIELIGRKLTIAFDYTMVTIGFSLLYLCPPKAVLTLLLFVIRTFSMAGSLAVIVYTAEVYPTVVRGLGMGILNTISRIGAVSTPFVAQVVFERSDYAALGIYAGSGTVTAILSLLLPLETKGKRLKDRH